MRIPSGVTDQYIYFVAVDSTDYVSRETGFSSFTVYRSRNGAAASAMTTPTINETDSSNMPGVYELLLDEDMTIDAGDDTQEMVFHITHAGMAPVSRTIELYRPKITAGEAITVSSGAVSTVTAVSNQVTADVTAISGDSTAADNAEAFFDGTGYAGTGNTIPTVTTVGTTTTNTDLVTAAAVRTEMDSNSTQLAAIVADTNELQTDDVPGLIASLNDVSTAEVNTQVVTALSDIGLDHLVSASVTGTDVTDDSIIATMVSKSATADWDSFANTTDALEAIRDNQAGADVAAIADAVWDEAKADHTGTATFGDLATDLDSVLTDTADMQPKLGSPAADVSADIAAVKVDTAATLVDTNELQGDWTNGGRLDLIIDAILADTGTDGVAISATVQNAIADAMLTRSASNVEDDGNTHNLAELILAAFESSLSGTTWTIKKTDGSTTYSTRTITTDADADPITAVT